MKEITIRGTRYEVHTLTGHVAGFSKHLETIVRGGGGAVINGNGGSAPVSSQTVIHDQLFLVDRSGREVPVKLTGWDLAVRQGHVLSLSWILRKGASFGPYVIVMNETTGEMKSADKVLSDLASPGALVPVLAVMAGLMSIPFIGGVPGMIMAGIGLWIALGHNRAVGNKAAQQLLSSRALLSS